MNDIAVMGPQGAGKGTQSALLAARTGLPHISLGALFRMEMAAGTELGKELAQYVERGEIAPGELAMRVLAERLSRPDAAGGVILDGFPRTVEQAEMCDRMLEGLGRGIAHAVLLQITDDESRDRLSKRIVCTNVDCGANYHLIALPPKSEGLCDLCGSILQSRADDVPEVVTRRLAIYHADTEPVAERYRAKGLLREVDGARTIEAVFADVLRAIGRA